MGQRLGCASYYNVRELIQRRRSHLERAGDLVFTPAPYGVAPVDQPKLAPDIVELRAILRHESETEEVVTSGAVTNDQEHAILSDLDMGRISSLVLTCSGPEIRVFTVAEASRMVWMAAARARRWQQGGRAPASL